MEKAIQESKKSEKLNTNEEAGPSNYQTNTSMKSTNEDSSNPVTISDDEESNSDSSIDTEYQYVNGIEDQRMYYLKVRENYANKNSDDPSFASEMEVYIKAQNKQLELVKDKLNDPDLSKAERRWHEGRQTVIVEELEDTLETKDNLEIMYRDDQRRIARLYDDEGLGKTPSPNPTPQIDEDSEDNNSSNSDEPDDSGPSANPSNPGPPAEPGNSSSNDTGPSEENGSYRIIVPLSMLNFVAGIIEHMSDSGFF